MGNFNSKTNKTKSKGKIEDPVSKTKYTKTKEDIQNEKLRETLCSIADDLKCPLCTKCIDLPIKTCLQGHGMCGNCSSENCSLCQQQWSSNQNTLLNKLVDSMLTVITASFKFKKSEEILHKIAENLKCQICFMCIEPPIKTCQSGHGVCGSCSSKIEDCPLCQKQWSSEQNVLLDKIVLKMLLPCAFQKFGCYQVTDIKTKALHESDCCYRVIDCPANCEWGGSVSKLAAHLKEVHPEEYLCNEGIVRVRANAKTTSRGPRFLISDNEVMLVNSDSFELPTTSFVVQSFGNKESVSNFLYKFTYRSEEGFTLTFEGTPVPYNTNLQEFFSSKKCFSIAEELYGKQLPDFDNEKLLVQVVKKNSVL